MSYLLYAAADSLAVRLGRWISRREHLNSPVLRIDTDNVVSVGSAPTFEATRTPFTYRFNVVPSYEYIRINFVLGDMTEKAVAGRVP